MSYRFFNRASVIDGLNRPAKTLKPSLAQYRHQQPNTHQSGGSKADDADQRYCVKQGRDLGYHDQRRTDDQGGDNDRKREAVADLVMGGKSALESPVFYFETELLPTNQAGDVE